VRFLWAEGLGAKDIHKETFPVCGGKCLSRKAVHSWVEKFSQGRSKFADDARPGAEVAETTVERLLRCGFRRTGKPTGQVYQCRWWICQEINVFFQVRISHFLRFISICDLFTDSPSYLHSVHWTEHEGVGHLSAYLSGHIETPFLLRWPLPLMPRSLAKARDHSGSVTYIK
jgi:hypothetical protein